jgi:hypothetical protein
MLCVRAPWRSFQRVYALRLCSVKVVSHGIIIRCCETTFKVAITRNAYTLLHPKGSETTSKVAVSRKAVRPPNVTFHLLMAPSLAAWRATLKISAWVDVSLCAWFAAPQSDTPTQKPLRCLCQTSSSSPHKKLFILRFRLRHEWLSREYGVKQTTVMMQRCLENGMGDSFFRTQHSSV